MTYHLTTPPVPSIAVQSARSADRHSCAAAAHRLQRRVTAAGVGRDRNRLRHAEQALRYLMANGMRCN
jgi:hypothetical protein